jgi:hypothetical protein
VLCVKTVRPTFGQTVERKHNQDAQAADATGTAAGDGREPGVPYSMIELGRRKSMATRADFTDDEWEAMRKGVTGAGMLVSIGDRDFTDTFGEVGALAKRLSEEREESPSDLMRELASGRASGFGLTASPEEVEAKTLEALRSATATLDAKAPEEAGAYRQLVLDVAESVAGAKGGVKPGETGAIEKIRDALGPG